MTALSQHLLGIIASSVLPSVEVAIPPGELTLPEHINSSTVNAPTLAVFTLSDILAPEFINASVLNAPEVSAVSIPLLVLPSHTNVSVLNTPNIFDPTKLILPEHVNVSVLNAPSLSSLVEFSAHRYWRVNMLEITGSNSYQVAEFEMHDTYGGSDLLSGGTASASNVANGAAANAVDDNAATVWRTNSVTLPQWWQYDFGSGNAKAICEIVMQAGVTNADSRTAIRFEVQYSDDGSAWTTAWEGRKRIWTSNESKTFVRPTVSYRINVSANDGAGAGSAHQVAELEFLVGGVDKSIGGNANVQGTGTAEADLAFDDDNGTVWSNAAMSQPYWLRYDFKDNPPFNLEAVSIVVGAANLTRAPKDFTIERSDDGGNTWDVLDTISGETAWGVNEKRTFTI